MHQTRHRRDPSGQSHQQPEPGAARPSTRAGCSAAPHCTCTHVAAKPSVARVHTKGEHLPTGLRRMRAQHAARRIRAAARQHHRGGRCVLPRLFVVAAVALLPLAHGMQPQSIHSGRPRPLLLLHEQLRCALVHPVHGAVVIRSSPSCVAVLHGRVPCACLMCKPHTLASKHVAFGGGCTPCTCHTCSSVLSAWSGMCGVCWRSHKAQQALN